MARVKENVHVISRPKTSQVKKNGEMLQRLKNVRVRRADEQKSSRRKRSMFRLVNVMIIIAAILCLSLIVFVSVALITNGKKATNVAVTESIETRKDEIKNTMALSPKTQEYETKLVAEKKQKEDGILTQPEIDALKNGDTIENAEKYENVSSKEDDESYEFSSRFFSVLGKYEELRGSAYRSDSYNKDKIKFINRWDEECVCQYGNNIISVVPSDIKGDLPVLYFNNEGYNIVQGYTDSFCADSFIAIEDGVEKVVGLLPSDDNTLTIIEADSGGHVINKTNESFEDSWYEAEERYQSSIVDYCTDEISGESVDCFLEGKVFNNGRAILSNAADGIRITTVEGEEIAFFENLHPDVVTGREHYYSYEGCLYGDFIVIYDYKSDGSMIMCLYVLK